MRLTEVKGTSVFFSKNSGDDFGFIKYVLKMIKYISRFELKKSKEVVLLSHDFCFFFVGTTSVSLKMKL